VLTAIHILIIRLTGTNNRKYEMQLLGMHKEDIKAALRKRYGTVKHFEEINGLTKGSVGEVLRKRRWAKVERAIEKAISDKPDSSPGSDSHRLNVTAA
jgi:lambda repressor-like predicted transcriptional regulator